MGKYKFNKEKLEFIEIRKGIKWWGRKIFQYTLISVILALSYYLILSLFFSTEAERQMARENKILEQEYKKMQEKLALLDNTVNNLKLKDREIYKSIFNAEPPVFSTMDPESELLYNIDTTKNEIIISRNKDILSQIEEDVMAVNTDIGSINKEFEYLGNSVRYIPSIIPLRDFSIGQTGASTGRKINPFYKTVMMHNGMDLLGGVGTEVLASADGVVVSAKRSGKGEGNTIILDHKNGYRTTYSHLGDILVRQGKKVLQGEVIGRVGLSGMSFAPHLHYQVWFHEKAMDPVNYYFAELTPEQYRDMVAIASNTGQSLD